jgi:hypothetical protein
MTQPSPSHRKPLFRRDDRAQMLLLTAFILAMSFIAMSSLSARIDQIPEQAERTRQGLFIDEVALIVDGAATAMNGLVVDYSSNSLGGVTFADELDDTIAHLVQVERSRGFFIGVGAVSCNDSGGEAELSVKFDIASADETVSLTVIRSYSSAIC